jgi:hypothetical protein
MKLLPWDTFKPALTETLSLKKKKVIICIGYRGEDVEPCLVEPEPKT